MNLSRQLKRVKQQADHLFLRSDRTDVVGELRTAEEQAEVLRLLCEAYTRSLEKVLHTHTTPEEKKLKKVPEYQVAECLKEGLHTLPTPVDEHDLIRNIVERVVEVQQALGMDVLTFEDHVEKQVLNPIVHMIKDDFPSIVKQKKQLKQIGLDLDAAKTRWRNYQANPNQNTKVDIYREELEEAESKLDQARDTYACDIFSLLSRHREVSQYICGYVELQREFLQRTLMRLDQVLPDMKQLLEDSSCSPAFGVPLHDHLRIVQKDIAMPIQVCVQRIIEVGLYEEGIFRVAGSTSKVRRLKGAFDANLVTSETLAMADEHDRDYDVHVVAGALKCYLRELPEPLLTHVLHDRWLEAVRMSDHQQRLKAMWMVVTQLPPDNLANLRYLIKFLTMLAGNQASNKMTPSNLAIVIAPNLIWAQRENDEQPDLSTLGRNMSLTSEYRSIVENLVEYCDYFFKEDVDFGVIPRVPPSPLLLHTAPNGTVPSTPSAQQRVASQGHRRNISADFGRSEGGTSLSTMPAVGECESPKQPQRTKKKPAPKPPMGRPSSTHGVNAQDMQGVSSVVNTSSASASPEQTRSMTPPRESGGGQSGTPASSRLHHSNSIKRPTAEPPRPPSSAPPKPPRPSPPIIDSQERLSKVQGESDTEGKTVPLGFEQIHTAKESDFEDDEVILRKKGDRDGSAPIGFMVDGESERGEGEEGNQSPKTSRSFRQSLENVLQLQAAGQPVALPRHSNMTTSTSSEGDATAPQAVLPLPRTSSVGESLRPVVPPTPIQRTTIPTLTAASTLPRTVKESNQTSAPERPDPLQRVDKPALPEKPSLMNRSTIAVDYSKPQVPERPTMVPPRSSSLSGSGNVVSSDVSSGAKDQESLDQVTLTQTNEDLASVSDSDKSQGRVGGIQTASEKAHVSVTQANSGEGITNHPDKPWKPPKPDKPPQLLARPPSLSSDQLDAIASVNAHLAGTNLKGSGKLTWPPSTDSATAASTVSEDEPAPDSTNL